MLITDIKKWKREHHYRFYEHKRKGKEYYAHKFDNLDEMGRFLERHNFPKLIQEEIDNLNGAISLNKLNQQLHLLKQKVSGLDGFTDEF